jgi:hypothetical protein
MTAAARGRVSAISGVPIMSISFCQRSSTLTKSSPGLQGGYGRCRIHNCTGVQSECHGSRSCRSIARGLRQSCSRKPVRGTSETVFAGWPEHKVSDQLSGNGIGHFLVLVEVNPFGTGAEQQC